MLLDIGNSTCGEGSFGFNHNAMAWGYFTTPAIFKNVIALILDKLLNYN